MIFVNSMSDLFHESIPLDYIARVFETMERGLKAQLTDFDLLFHHDRE